MTSSGPLDSNIAMLNLVDNSNNNLTTALRKDNEEKIQIKKAPRRILHFSDGTLEEYSSDEEDETDKALLKKEPVDPSTLPWGSWMYHQASSTGGQALAVCDYLGENLAYYLGITSPKYQYEIEEHERILKEEEEERRKVAEEMVGWSISDSAPPSLVNPPSATSNTLHPLAQAYMLSSSEVSLATAGPDRSAAATNAEDSNGNERY